MTVSRHFARIILMQSIFEWEFHGKKLGLNVYFDRNALECNLEKESSDFGDQLIRVITEHLEEIRGFIQKYAPDWPVDKISSVDRAILYIGISEMVFAHFKDVPAIVSIDEAIEMAKSYGSDNSSKFINGVLSNIYENEMEEGKKVKG